jgi:hypothetical protein
MHVLKNPIFELRSFYESAAEIQTTIFCVIWGFHSGGYEEYHLLEYDAV